MYQYQPLRPRQIRLLELLPGTFAAPVRIKIKVIDFSESCKPFYVALSYTWGSTENKTSIGVESQKRVISQIILAFKAQKGNSTAQGYQSFPVTHNLAEALQCLRHESQTQSLWIDAICIDQSNDIERSEQVAMMYEIYHRADRVMVWLGAAADDSGIAMEKLDEIGRTIVVDWGDFTKRLAPGGDERYINTDQNIVFDRTTYHSMFQLLGRPWFQRLWVVQEVHQPNLRALVVCGNDRISWDSFCNAVFWLNRSTYVLHGCKEQSHLWDQRRNAIYKIAQLSKRPQAVESFHGVRRRVKHLHCADPKDQIFALQGMLAPRRAIKIDYTKSVAEIYESMTLHTMRMDGNLLMLLECDLNDGRSSHPTWVPRFDVGSLLVTSNVLPAAGLSRVEMVSVHHHILTLKGVLAQEVCQVLRVADRSMVNCLSNLSPQIEDLGKAYPGGGSVLEAWCRVMVNNQFHDYFVEPIPGKSDIKSILAFVWRSLREQRLQLYNGGDEISFYLDNFNSNTRRKALFATGGNYFGIASQAILPGDQIWVLLGSWNPIVLRPVRDHHYEVVGPAYVYGLDQAEIILGPLPNPWKIKIRMDSQGIPWPAFIDEETGEITKDDPRLGKELPKGWSFASHVDQDIHSLFRGSDGTSDTWFDPRLTSELLAKRGVNIETISLL